jgi:hypothetical protein
MAQGNTTGISVDIDGTLSTDSDLLIPSQKAVKTYVDSKVSDSITDGVTTIAPSQNAVFDALALKQDKNTSETFIYSKANQVLASHTGTTAETVLLAIPISANDFDIGDYVTVLLDFTKIGAGGTVGYRMRAGTNGNLLDNTIARSIVAGSLDLSFERKRFQLLTGNLLSGFNSTTLSNTDVTSNASAKTSLSINPTSLWYITITAVLSNVADEAQLVGARISKIKTF